MCCIARISITARTTNNIKTHFLITKVERRILTELCFAAVVN